MRTHWMARLGMWFLGGLLGVALMVPFLGGTPLTGWKPVEYRTLALSFPPPPTLLQSKLAEYGEEGWELVAVLSQGGILIFKR